MFLNLIGNYILSGKLQAIATTTFSILISLLVPPFAYVISGSVVALIALRKGLFTCLQVLAASLLILQVFSIFTGLPVQLSLVYALLVWLPVWVASGVLRLTERQGILLAATGFTGTALVLAMYLIVDDVAAWWRLWLDIMLDKTFPPDRAGQYKAVLEPAMPMLNAIMIAGLMLNIFMSVLLARWWQSRLFNPGAFQKEFHALRLPPALLMAGVVIIALVFSVGAPWHEMSRDILVIIMFMYLIQGIASVHRSVARFGLSSGWLVSMYCLLALLPEMRLFIAGLGMTDSYVNWRRSRINSKTKS